MVHIAAMDMVCLTLAFIDGLGAPEMVLIFIIVLVLFGGNKLPEFARGLGKSIREFKKAAAGVEEEFKRALEEDERKNATPQLAPPAETSPTATPDPAGPGASTQPHDEYHDYHHDYQADPNDALTPASPATGEPAAGPSTATAPVAAVLPAGAPADNASATASSAIAPAPDVKAPTAPAPVAPPPPAVPADAGHPEKP